MTMMYDDDNAESLMANGDANAEDDNYALPNGKGKNRYERKWGVMQPKPRTKHANEGGSSLFNVHQSRQRIFPV
jgi:hypothetical protein